MKSNRQNDPAHVQGSSTALALGALGVVFGDIGTSPLYALKECFAPSHGLPVSAGNVLGILSLILWSLMLIVSIKYLMVVMRANSRGEGGILSLLTLAIPGRGHGGRSRKVLVGFGLFGAALLYGDGMITPSISVLSAIEGLDVATPKLAGFVVPLTVLTLVGVFSIQRMGTDRVGGMFGPVMAVWFIVIALLGLKSIVSNPSVLAAFNPWYGFDFFRREGFHAFAVLGSVFLAVTGAEALYADMGHFGIRPIRRSWFVLVLPSLVLSYLGQGAMLLRDASTASHPFYKLAPSWAVVPLVCLATAAAVIASQALISGAFSLTMQAVQLGYLPRMAIKHTSSTARGQIYMPHVNWFLLLSCVGLVLGFRTSTGLAAAYGIAVTLTMIITTILVYFVARRAWGWSTTRALLVCGLFIIPEIAFCAANFLKVAQGGWFPLAIGVLLYTAMATWTTGRRVLRARLERSFLPLETFLESVQIDPPLKVRGTAIFLAGNPSGTPLALIHNLKHNKVLHERIILLTIATQESPHVDEAERVHVADIGTGFYRVTGHYGFMDEADIPELLRRCADHGLSIDPEQATYFLSRETILPCDRPGMALWRERLFAFMARNAQPATAFFNLPANRVVELGMQVEF